MGETPDEIKREIEQTRERIGANLNQLEHRVRSAMDWRAQFDRRPWAFVGGAFGAAFLLGWLTAPDPSRDRFDRWQ
jgi:ElaB/YqjD/DUF883 family membrane-anchored ribosome-binding protein